MWEGWKYLVVEDKERNNMKNNDIIIFYNLLIFWIFKNYIKKYFNFNCKSQYFRF